MRAGFFILEVCFLNNQSNARSMVVLQKNAPGNMVLEKILRELNPIHDLDNISFRKLSTEESIGKVLEAALHNLSAISYGAYIAKPLLRGLIIGGLFGAGIGEFIDYPHWNSVTDGAILGSLLDGKQMSIRMVLHYFEQQF